MTDSRIDAEKQMSIIVHKFSKVQRAEVLQVSEGASVLVTSELCSDSTNPERRELKRFLTTSGTLQERGRSWQQAWKFEWPSEDVADLEAGLTPILRHVDFSKLNPPLPPTLRYEISADIYDWLQVGWIEKEGTPKGYLRFRKDGLEMVSEFRDIDGLVGIRNALRR